MEGEETRRQRVHLDLFFSLGAFHFPIEAQTTLQWVLIAKQIKDGSAPPPSVSMGMWWQRERGVGKYEILKFVHT